MKTILLAVCNIIIPLFAAESSGVDLRKDLVRELLEAQGGEAIHQAMVNESFSAQIEFATKNMPEELQAATRSAMVEVQGFIAQRLAYQDLQEELVEFWSTRVDEESLSAAVAFFRSPAGEAIIANQKDAALLGMRWGARSVAALQPEIIAIVNRHLEPVIAASAKSAMTASISVGDAFPATESRDLSGNVVRLEDLRGQIVVLDFWATWCGPCVQEMPYLQAVHERFADQGVSVVSLSLDESRADLDAFLQDRLVPWDVWHDGSGWEHPTVKALGIKAIPQIVVLDRQGRVLEPNVRGEAIAVAVQAALVADAEVGGGPRDPVAP